jgi:hypothetical protein
LTLKVVFQSHLNFARGFSPLDATEIRPVGAVPVGIIELGVVEHVEELGSKLKPLALPGGQDFVQRKIEIIDRGPAAISPLGTPNLSEQGGHHRGIFCKGVGIEILI